VCAAFSQHNEKISVFPQGQSRMKKVYHMKYQPTKLKSIKFSLITINTTSMMMKDFIGKSLHILTPQVIISWYTN
jgi:hypothetical protein